MLNFSMLEQQRISKGYTYETLERLSGFSKSEIHRLLNGKCKNINWDRLETLCRLLDFSVLQMIQ